MRPDHRVRGRNGGEQQAVAVSPGRRRQEGGPHDQGVTGEGVEIREGDHADGVLVLSGTQNSPGWTLTINEPTGYMVLSVAVDQGAFVVMGACTPP